MDFCQPCALRITAAVAQHHDLSALDSDALERRKQHRDNVSKQRCYAALEHGFLRIGLSVDPEHRVGQEPGTRLLFVLDGPGAKRQREVFHQLRESQAKEYGANYFRLTTDVVDWIAEHHHAEETVS